MAYGDTGFAPDGDPFAGLPFTEGKFIGKDAAGAEIVKAKKFLLDTGAQVSVIDQANLMGMNVTFVGAAEVGGVGGGGAAPLFKGAKFQFKGKDAGGAFKDCTCTEPFVLLGLPFAILGRDQLKATSSKLTFDYAANTVTINCPGS